MNANGALLLLSVPVRKGQKLLLTNTLTQKEQDCRVVFLGTRRSRTVEAGVAFPLTNPDFWHLPTAPADEKPRHDLREFILEFEIANFEICNTKSIICDLQFVDRRQEILPV